MLPRLTYPSDRYFPIRSGKILAWLLNLLHQLMRGCAIGASRENRESQDCEFSWFKEKLSEQLHVPGNSVTFDTPLQGFLLEISEKSAHTLISISPRNIPDVLSDNQFFTTIFTVRMFLINLIQSELSLSICSLATCGISKWMFSKNCQISECLLVEFRSQSLEGASRKYVILVGYPELG